MDAAKREDLAPRPNDIPTNPQQLYDEFRQKGGWGAWLGTGTVAPHLRTYRSYDDAVPFVQALKLKSGSEWRAYCRGERKDLRPRPNDIPAGPERTYGEEFLERGGMGAWLGTGRIADHLKTYRTYAEAVRFVHTLKLKSQKEWLAYCRGERKDLPPKPNDIPADPSKPYGEEFREKGHMGAWLGTGTVANKLRTYRTYDEAAKFVHSLGLKSETEWRAYCRKKLPHLPPKPTDIPAAPIHVYKDFFQRGGMGAWLGTGRVADRLKTYQTYEEAVRFVHELKLKNQNEWRAYCRGERKDLPPRPNDIPAGPERTYGEQFHEKGGSGAWLGTGFVALGLRIYRTYDDAVKFVHQLRLKSQKEWRQYCRGERKDLLAKPNDIPADPIGT